MVNFKASTLVLSHPSLKCKTGQGLELATVPRKALPASICSQKWWTQCAAQRTRSHGQLHKANRSTRKFWKSSPTAVVLCSVKTGHRRGHIFRSYHHGGAPDMVNVCPQISLDALTTKTSAAVGPCLLGASFAWSTVKITRGHEQRVRTGPILLLVAGTYLLPPI